jgi:solute carrier family 25 (mitochondrial adenine nucleotide translocator), member 4/5/6/31
MPLTAIFLSQNCVRAYQSQTLTQRRYRAVFMPGVPVTDFWRYLGYSLLAGGLSGGTSLVVLYPFDFARTRVGTDVGVGKHRLYTGSIDCLRKTLAAEGLRGVYRGFDVALVGIVAWRALYFGCYDSATMHIFGDRRGGSFAQRWAVAQAVTSVAGTAVYPLDTVRRRMMMQSGRQAVLYKSSWHCCLTMARTEGVRGFYRGLSANLFRGMGGALMLVLFDEIKAIMSKDEDHT